MIAYFYFIVIDFSSLEINTIFLGAGIVYSIFGVILIYAYEKENRTDFYKLF